MENDWYDEMDVVDDLIDQCDWYIDTECNIDTDAFMDFSEMENLSIDEVISIENSMRETFGCQPTVGNMNGVILLPLCERSISGKKMRPFEIHVKSTLKNIDLRRR